MWQITWMIAAVPEWFWTAVTVLGLVSLAASWLSTPWRVPLKIGGIFAIVVGSWCMGIAANEATWQAKVKKLENDLAVARSESKNENVALEEKVVYVDRVVKERGADIVKYIDRDIVEKEEVKEFIERCPIPKDIIEQHNAAAMLNQAARRQQSEDTR